MRRLSAIRTLVFCAVVSVALAAGQDSNANLEVSPTTGGTILDISLSTDREGVTIAVTTDAPVIPEIARLAHPDRLVFDFPGFSLAGSNQRTPVNNGPVVAVRASLFRSEPPTSRIVIDLKEPLEPQLRLEGNKLSITLRFAQPVAEIHESDSNRQPSVPKPSALAPPNLPTAPPPAGRRNLSTAEPNEYELLEKARALRLEDLKGLEERANAGDPEAETILALAYHSAVLLKNDEAEALRLLHHAAGKKFVAAEESLGIFYAAGIGMAEPNPGEALTWYRKAAQHGSVDAATNIATMYATGDGVPRDMDAAIPWFRQAAEAGGATAQYNLALIYGRGDGLARDEQKSLDWLVKAADQDVIPALVDLGNRYLHPSDGSKTDVPRAIQRYQRAAELGDGRAQAILGDIYSGGAWVAADYQQAVKWYRLAADQGQRDGEFGLAARYVLGQGVAADPAEAFRWFKAAAEQGHANAQYDLGRLYEVGRGTSRDLSLAVHYYELAAQQGVVKAQYQLGVLLAKGESVRSDPVSAYKWLLLAQDSVYESAAALSDLRKSMAPADIADAEHQVDAWRIAHQDSGRGSATH